MAVGTAQTSVVAVGVDAPGGQHRLGGGVGVVLEVATVEEQVVQLNVVETAGTPRLELNFDLSADP